MATNPFDLPREESTAAVARRDDDDDAQDDLQMLGAILGEYTDVSFFFFFKGSDPILMFVLIVSDFI